MSDVTDHLAVLMGLMAGDTYDQAAPPVPPMEATKTFDDLVRLGEGGQPDKIKTDPNAELDISGDASLVAARAAYMAGFRGEALVNMIAIAGRESAFNPGSVGDVKLQNGTWGPSVGLFQIRTLKGDTGTGSARDIARLQNNPLEQAKAAFELSGGGKNFGPWKLHGGSFLASTNVAEARRIAALIEGGG